MVGAESVVLEKKVLTPEVVRPPPPPSLPPPPLTPPQIALRKKYTKIAKHEVDLILKMKKGEMACAEEVRTIHLPAHKAAEITNFAAVNDDLVHNGKYGGSKVHLQMDLPPNYPINARTCASEVAERARDKKAAAAGVTSGCRGETLRL
jgi:hypothetical protein